MTGISSKHPITPKIYERDALCEQHGNHTEKGFSLSGLETATRWLGCANCNKAKQLAEELRQRADQESARQRRLEQRLDMAGIPKAFRFCSFHNFEIKSEEMKHALSVAHTYASDFHSKHFKRGTGLVFGGGVGTGKTHLAMAIANHLLNSCTVMAIDAMNLIRHVRSTWRRDSPMSEEEVMNMYGYAFDLLIIDEVGVQRGTEDEQAIIFEIFNRRYGNLLPTILITNVGAKALNEFLGPRTWDRLYERSEFVRFGWETWRTKLRTAGSSSRVSHS